MFMTGQVPNLEHTNILARLLANNVKAWLPLLLPGKIAVNRREIALDQLVHLLYKCGESVVNYAGDVLSGSADIIPSLRGRKNLGLINDAWRAGTTLATGVLQAMGLVAEKKSEAIKIDEAERRKLHGKISQDVIAPLKSLLESKGLKPQSNNSDWDAYFVFLRLLEGKQTEADRKKAVRAASVAPSREGTPVVKSKSRARKPLQFKPADEAEDENEEEVVPNKIRGTRSRAAKKQDEEIESTAGSEVHSPAPARSDVDSEAEREEPHNEDEEEDEEEPIKPARKQRKPRATFQPIDEDEESANGDDEDEELPDLNEVVRGKAAKGSTLGKRKEVEEPEAEPGAPASPKIEAPTKRKRIGG